MKGVTYERLSLRCSYGFTLKWLATQRHSPEKFTQVSVKRPRRSKGFPLSLAFFQIGSGDDGGVAVHVHLHVVGLQDVGLVRRIADRGQHGGFVHRVAVRDGHDEIVGEQHIDGVGIVV